MLNVEFTLNVLTPDFFSIGSLCLPGYLSAEPSVEEKAIKIAELRKEIVYNHAQILELQTEYVTLEKDIKYQ